MKSCVTRPKTVRSWNIHKLFTLWQFTISSFPSWVLQYIGIPIQINLWLKIFTINTASDSCIRHSVQMVDIDSWNIVLDKIQRWLNQKIFMLKEQKRLKLNSILQIQYRNKQDTIASFNGYRRENGLCNLTHSHTQNLEML